MIECIKSAWIKSENFDIGILRSIKTLLECILADQNY